MQRLTGTLLLLFALAMSSAWAERLPVRGFDITDGLGSDFVECLTSDSRGFLWVCTRDGLSRFDGREFVTYTTADGLSNPTVMDLVETADGGYHVATNGGGVCRFDPDARVEAARPDAPLFSCLSVGDTPESNRVNVLLEDRDGTLWAGSDGGAFRFDGSGFRRADWGLDIPAVREPAVFDLAEDREGNLWVGSTRGLIRRFPDGGVVHYDLLRSPSNGNIRALAEDADGDLWIGHTRGLLRVRLRPAGRAGKGTAAGIPISEAGDVFEHGPPGEGRFRGILDIAAADDGRVFVSGREGVTRFENGSWRTYDSRHGLASDSLTDLEIDRDGNLWIGTRHAGVLQWIADGLVTYTEEDGLGVPPGEGGFEDHAGLRIHSIHEDEAGRIYVASGIWLLNRFDGDGFTAVRPAIPAGARHAWLSQSAFLDGEGAWWLLSQDGLWRLPRASRWELLHRKAPVETWDSDHGLPADSVRRMFEDSQGRLWLAFNEPDPGLARIDRANGAVRVFSEADGVPADNPPHAFAEHPTGVMWIGLYDGGLLRGTESGFERFDGSDGLPRGGIHDLMVDGQGRLWMTSTRDGIARLDDPGAERPTFTHYGVEHGLASDNVRCLADDALGRIYAGTVRGLSRLDPETGRFEHFDTGDGLAANFVSCAHRDRSGRLWFGTVHGLSRLDPAKERRSADPPVVRIGGIDAGGTRLPVPELGATSIEEIVLAPRRNRLRVEYFGIGSDLSYRHRLDGGDDQWSEPTLSRSITYANLAPGRYRFIVEALGPGARAGDPASVVFRVLPPVWMRGWFVVAVSLLVAAALYGLYRLRLARMLALERVRTRIATDLHDDVGSSLSQISILSELARRRIDPVAPEAAGLVAEIGESARRLVDRAGDIVWSIDPGRDDLGSLITRLRKFAFDVFEERDVAVRFEAPDEPERVRLAPEARRHLYLILKEAVNNVVRHAAASTVEISIRVCGRNVVAGVRDDGEGFEPERRGLRAEGHGLANMRQRAEAAGGRLEVSSTVGRGTRVVVKLPLRRHGAA